MTEFSPDRVLAQYNAIRDDEAQLMRRFSELGSERAALHAPSADAHLADAARGVPGARSWP